MRERGGTTRRLGRGFAACQDNAQVVQRASGKSGASARALSRAWPAGGEALPAGEVGRLNCSRPRQSPGPVEVAFSSWLRASANCPERIISTASRFSASGKDGPAARRHGLPERASAWLPALLRSNARLYWASGSRGLRSTTWAMYVSAASRGSPPQPGGPQPPEIASKRAGHASREGQGTAPGLDSRRASSRISSASAPPQYHFHQLAKKVRGRQDRSRSRTLFRTTIRWEARDRGGNETGRSGWSKKRNCRLALQGW